MENCRRNDRTLPGMVHSHRLPPFLYTTHTQQQMIPLEMCGILNHPVIITWGTLRCILYYFYTVRLERAFRHSMWAFSSFHLQMQPHISSLAPPRPLALYSVTDQLRPKGALTIPSKRLKKEHPMIFWCFLERTIDTKKGAGQNENVCACDLLKTNIPRYYSFYLRYNHYISGHYCRNWGGREF